MFDGGKMIGVVTLDDLRACYRQLVEIEAKRVHPSGLDEGAMKLMIGMRDACASVAHNYGHDDDQKAVEVAADIERLIRELKPEDALE